MRAALKSRYLLCLVSLVATGIIIYGCAAPSLNRAREVAGSRAPAEPRDTQYQTERTYDDIELSTAAPRLSDPAATEPGANPNLVANGPVDAFDATQLPADDPDPKRQTAPNEWARLFEEGEAPLRTNARPKKPAPSDAPGRGVAENRKLVAAQSLPSPEEELWVIQKPATAADAREIDGNPIPGSGTLVATPPGQQQLVPVPLKHTDVKANIAGHIATVDVQQQFHNPYDGKIEAVYVFPLPANAAVNEFVMTVGERKIRGIIREREEAQRIYAEARNTGHVAALLTQERPNVFTQKVANIEPGKAIDIDIRYFHTLGYSDGWYEFVFPMVVGPRFNPAGTTGGVGSVGQGSAGASGQTTEVQYLRPENRSGHDIGLTVNLDAGVPVEQIESRNHQVKVKKDAPARATVALDAADSVPNKDFVLRYKVAGEHTKSGLIAQKDEKGQGYFTLMLIPAENLGSLPPRPLEMVFTLDVSGSMNGQPIEQSKNAMRYALTRMGPDDTFQVVQFANDARRMSAKPLAATPENVRRALAYIEGAQGGGGTMMLEGIRASLDFPHDESRLRFVTFLTDGYIGNEAEIFKAVKSSLGPARVFSFGVGSSTNRYLLDGLARQGRGAVAYLGLQDNASEVMAKFYERIRRPALTDVEVDWGGMQVSEVFPRQIPDLFVGRPVVLTGKFAGEPGNGTIRVRGRVGNEVQSIEVPVRAEAPSVEKKALPAVWARMKIADLADEAAMSPDTDVTGEVRQVALEYGLMSSFTAFLAIDSSTRTAGTFGTTVAVPVPVPQGVRYDTAVQEK